MAEKPALTNLLKANAGISDQAALVYKYVLMVGTLTIGEVCEYTGLDFEIALRALKELVDGRLVRKLEHVVDRYVAVAPYRVFAEHLVEFQRIIREVEENAKKSIDATLLEVSRVNDQWKGSATRLREEELGRARLETNRLKEESQKARDSLIEKLRRETEEEKSMISETLKKHLEEHATRISDAKRDVSLNLENSVVKFAETTKKLKEEVAQATSSYLSRFDEKMQLFLNAVNSDLSTFQSEFSSSADKFQGEVFAALETSNTKVGELTETMKTGTNAMLREVGQTYSQLSTELQSSASNNISSTVAAISSGNKELESNLKDIFQKHEEKLGEDINSFQTRTRESIDIWRSAYKGELESHAKNLKVTVEGCQQGLVQNLESTKASMSELLKTYSTSAKSATDTLGSNLDGVGVSVKKNLTLELTAPKDALQKSCDMTAKNCFALATTLESLSKKNIPLTSKTIEDFTQEFSGKISKMKATFIEDARSFVGDIKEGLISTLSATEDTSQSPGKTPAATARGMKTDATRAKSPLIKETTKRVDEAGRSYIEAMKKSIDSLEKSTSERVSSILRFEDELGKKWESIADTMGKVTELAGKIKLFPSEIGKPADELLEQYVGKVDESLSSTRRLLNAHLLSLGDQASGTLKKWSSTVDKTKKELSDLFIKKQEGELGVFVSSQIAVMQKIATDRGEELADLATSKVESFKSQALTTQSTITKYLASNTELVRRSLEDIENKLKSDLESSVHEFAQKTESKCKENEDSSTRITSETSKVVADLKEQFNLVINEEREKVKQICENTGSKLKETTSENSRELSSIVSSLTSSFTAIIDAASEGYKKECESTKATVITLLSEHLKNYTETVTKITAEINSTFSKHFDGCSELTGSFQKKLEELLTTHQNGYEASSNKMLGGLINCIDQDEKAISQDAREMLKEFTDNTTKTAKESNSVETLLKTAWAEITDTQQINADKTWHYVTKRAILNHIKDMVGRSKSTVTIVVPNLHEAPTSEIKRISKSIRINIVAGVDATLHKNLVTELLNQGNVRIWNFPERNYLSCTRDAEEVLIAPIAPKDIDCIATVSVEDGFIKLIMKIVGPMWLAASKMVSLDSLKT